MLGNCVIEFMHDVAHRVPDRLFPAVGTGEITAAVVVTCLAPAVMYCVLHLHTLMVLDAIVDVLVLLLVPVLLLSLNIAPTASQLWHGTRVSRIACLLCCCGHAWTLAPSIWRDPSCRSGTDFVAVVCRCAVVIKRAVKCKGRDRGAGGVGRANAEFTGIRTELFCGGPRALSCRLVPYRRWNRWRQRREACPTEFARDDSCCGEDDFGDQLLFPAQRLVTVSTFWRWLFVLRCTVL